MIKTVLLVSLTFACTCVQAQQVPVDQQIKKGNDLYRQQQYEPAARAYDEAIIKDPTNIIAVYNRANTSYRMSRASEAIQSYDRLAAQGQQVEGKAKAFYNKGVVLSGQKRLEESIEAYKNSLRQNPDDREVRENLQKALMELKKKEPPPKKEKENKKQEQKKQQPQPKMNKKETEQKLDLLQQKEKELQQRIQKEKSKNGGGGQKDW